MLEGLERNMEGLRDLGDSEGTRELQSNEAEYLSELQMPSDRWNELSGAEQTEHLNMIVARMEELNLPDGMNRQDIMKDLFAPEIAEAYLQIEAPQDFIQIEQISDTLSTCEEVKMSNWRKLELNEKVEVLNDLENRIAAIEHRPPCTIKAIPLKDGHFGYFDGKDITINSKYMEMSGENKKDYREVIDTVLHEGRHAYQNYNINVCEVHPRHSEVESWRDTHGDGKWRYWGSTYTRLGQRLYEQQSVEIDARNFASDVLDKCWNKLCV